jgi:hypothetical protein
MTMSRRLLMSVAGWLAIVAVGSTLVWAVVAHAGRDVGDPESDTIAASAGTEPTVGASSSGQPTGSAQPSASPTGSTSASPTPDPTGSVGGSPTPNPTGSVGGSPTPDPTGNADPSPTPDPTGNAEPPATTAPPPAQSHEKTWQGTSGRVVASCTGAKISLVAAQPNNGWRVEVENPGPEELSVKFELTEDEEDDRIASWSARGLLEEVEVHAYCAGGVPSFSEDS